MAAQEAAAHELGEEVQRVRAEADARLNAEIARLREESDRARLEQQARHDDNARDQEARHAADQEAARTLETEVARVRAESEAGLLAELERLRKEAAEARRAHEDTQREIELLREGAEIEARQQAEEAAARALESEVARLKAEADARLNEELARVRAEAEESKREQAQAQRHNDSAEEVRRQAEEAAARALEAEVARVRAEANARLEEELSLVRQEAEAVREAFEQEKREAEQMRQRQAQEWRAEQDASRALEAETERMRREADAKLRHETQRARQEANSRLEVEVAAAKAEAEQRRTTELEEVRAQVLRLRTAAAEQARAAAEQAVAAEVARAKALTPATPLPPRQELATQWTSDAFVADDARRQRSARRVPSNKKVWVIGAAASIVLLVSSVFAFGVLGKPSEKTSNPAPKSNATDDAAADMTVVTNGPTGELRIESTPDGARVILDGKESGFTPLTLNSVPAGRHLLVLEGENGTVRRTVRVQAAERTIARYEITGGFIAITSKFPVEVYENNKRVGISSEGHIALAPGRHKVTLVNSRFNYRDEVELAVKAGEVTTHTVEAPMGVLIVNTTPGAEVFVDGQRVGSAPLAPIPAAVGLARRPRPPRRAR
jgi:hypothetical protein